MKIKSIVVWGAVFMLSVSVARATHVWEEGYWSKEADTPKFNSQELSLDLFGSYIGHEGNLDDLFKTDVAHGVWGGGAGLNYFFMRDLGIGVDSTISDFDGGNWRFNNVLGDVYLRLPLADTVAPYFIVSGGRGITPVWQWVYGGGVGLEFRFSPKVGVFSDVRFLWSHESSALNTLGARFGVRVNF